MLNDKNEVLLVTESHSPGIWKIPGGMLNTGILFLLLILFLLFLLSILFYFIIICFVNDPFVILQKERKYHRQQ